MSRNTLIVIPARLSSQRLKVKMLADIHGYPMIYWTAMRISKMQLSEYVVATDSKCIFDICESHGLNVMMTSHHCTNGTGRVYDVSHSRQYDFYVNVQGDEPLVLKSNVKSIIDSAEENAGFVVALTDVPAGENDISDVKALVIQNEVVNLSRETRVLNHQRDTYRQPSQIGRVVGLYKYTSKFLSDFCSARQGPRERKEKIEQLRCIENKLKIVSHFIENAPRSVDTLQDLDRVRSTSRDLLEEV